MPLAERESGLKEFDYAAATSVDEAVSLLAAQGDRARVLAGGTDILVQLREGQRDASLVVDVKKIPDLMEITALSGGAWRIGAAVPCYQIYDHVELGAAYPGLVDAARIIGGWQIQSRASLGGNLCNSSPAADSVPAMIALGAVAHIAGPGGPRSVPVAEFCTGPGKNQLGRGEFLVALELPAPVSRGSSAYLRFIPRNEMDIAVVGVGVSVQLDSAGKTVKSGCVALGAVAPTAVIAQEASDYLAGQPAGEATFARAGELARAAARPISDRRGPADYRTHLVGVLTKRALVQAVARATGASIQGH